MIPPRYSLAGRAKCFRPGDALREPGGSEPWDRLLSHGHRETGAMAHVRPLGPIGSAIGLGAGRGQNYKQRRRHMTPVHLRGKKTVWFRDDSCVTRTRWRA